MSTRRRTSPAAVLLVALGLALTAGCTGSSEEPADAAQTGGELTWPEAIDVDEAEGEFWVVWTGVAESGADVEAALQPSVDALAEVGYDTLPWDPKCQSGAEESLIALTGYADPLGVGVPFATAEDAGAFDTLYEGAVVTVTPGTHTCGA